jgi:hypothetical protein
VSESEQRDVATPPPLVLIKQDATPEEIAALTAVLTAMTGPERSAQQPRREWGAPYRKVRPALSPSPGGWKASALPR